NDEESNHEDASDTGAAPKQQQYVIPQTTAISNIKLPILKKEEYDIWAMEMEHYLENAKNILLMAIPKEHMRRFHGMDDAKEIWEAIRTRIFEQEIQGASKTSSSAQNVAFVSQSKSSTNKVKSGFTSTYSTCTPSTSSTNTPEKEALAGFADEVIYSLFAKQSEDWDLLHEDLEQIDDLDIEEMDINWQIAMIAIRMKKFYKKIGRRVRVDGKAPVGFDKKKLEFFNCHNIHFSRECIAKGTHDEKKKRDSFYQHQEAGKQEKNQMGLLTTDDGIINWGEHTKDEETNHALMAISSSSEGPQEPEPSVSDDRSSEYSTCQSNDSAGSIGTSTEHSVDPESEISRVPQEVYVSTPITTNEELECYDGKRTRGREAEVKKQRVFNTGNGVAKPVWTNANRVNHSNKFVPRSVQLNAGRPNINSVRPNINTGSTNINSGRKNVNPVRPRVNIGSFNVRSRQPVPNKTSNSFSPKRPQVNQFNQRGHFSKSYSSVRRPFAKTTAQMSHSHAVKGNWGSVVKTSAGYNWRNSKPNSNCDSGPTFIRTDHPLKNMVDRGIFDSGCSGHMTGNKDQLEDFEEFNGGSVTFGGSKGYISGKGKIRVGNLDFDSVSFVKELGHFNLFSISQIYDKQHKVLFTETECLVVSSDFKMPDENQIL
ncbi:hypothetical protein Tco_1320050, partial [Tanacetum coccineum]